MLFFVFIPLFYDAVAAAESRSID